MASATATPVEVYLSTTYRPDCDYIDGEVKERNVGEYDHARTQGLLLGYVGQRESSFSIRVVPAQRVRVAAGRFRVADVAVVLSDAPRQQIVTEPPYLCIEVLSPDDTVANMQDRVDDYLSMGVPNVWLVNPRNRRAWMYMPGAIREAADGVLRTSDGRVAVPLGEIFDPEA